MTTEDVPEIPTEIASLMNDEELDNMRSLDGWAVGSVACYENRTQIALLSDAWIELFNGDGRAGEFGGVRFMALDEDGQLQEAYAYGSFGALRENAATGWCVQNYRVPDNPDVGQEAPEGIA